VKQAVYSLVLCGAFVQPAWPAAVVPFDPAAAERFAGMALACLHQEYPNHLSHSMNSDADARPPHELTPAPAVVTDRSDPRLAHLDGLNLSRAWSLEGMAQGLPQGDRRIGALLAAAAAHREAALPNITGEYYEGGHWLATFAVYLTSGAGLR
jgi:hypothetical protein